MKRKRGWSRGLTDDEVDAVLCEDAHDAEMGALPDAGFNPPRSARSQERDARAAGLRPLVKTGHLRLVVDNSPRRGGIKRIRPTRTSTDGGGPEAA
jgi:hypothetical protein